MLDTDFRDALNAYTAQAESVGAAVLYHFPPMNVLAVSNAENIDTYADYLQSQLTAPLAGDPHACVMDAGWFYDTNFHLNMSGKTAFTRQLIRDLKAVLGDTSVYRNRSCPPCPPAGYRPKQKPRITAMLHILHGKVTVLSSMRRDEAAAP